MPVNPAKKSRCHGSLSRRVFLRGVVTTLSGVVVAACGTMRSNDPPLTLLGPAATPQPILPSPQPAAASAQATPQPDAAALEQFLAISVLLTGVKNLTPTLGAVYLQSLQADATLGANLRTLYEQAGLGSDSPATLAELEANGFFAEEGRRALTDRILELWYTGVYTTAEGEEQVATFVDALAWQTLTFTKPLTLCGSPGFWSEPPELVLD